MCEDFVNVFQKNLQQRKGLVFSVDAFENLTVPEVIDSLEKQFKDDCCNMVTGVRLTSRHCFISVNNSAGYHKLLGASLQIRDKTMMLKDVWERSTILQLSAVPHYVMDEQVVATVTRFADVIGNVERQSYKGCDTGERFVHIKTPEVIPCQLLLGSVCIPVTIIFPRHQRSYNGLRPKSIDLKLLHLLDGPQTDSSRTPSQESISKQLPAESTAIPPAPEVDSNGVPFPNPTVVQYFTLQNGWKKKPNPISIWNKNDESETPSAFRTFAQHSANSLRRDQNCHNSVQLPRRTSVSFTCEGIGRSRSADGYWNNEYGSAYMNRERSASDASSGRQSICRRKLSMTGHEESTKIPWCGCWGIGCC